MLRALKMKTWIVVTIGVLSISTLWMFFHSAVPPINSLFIHLPGNLYKIPAFYVPEPAVCSECVSGIPCEYNNEVDFRVIVLGFNRAKSLEACLGHIENVVMDGKSIAVEIFLDRDKKGAVHNDTVNAAVKLASSFNLGKACVHVQTNHSFTAKQWMLSWRPKKGSSEIGLIVEDDIDLSPYAFRWLYALHQKYGQQEDIYGYSLQMENVVFQRPPHKKAQGPKNETIFLMPLWATWGFAPKPKFWRKFQDWYMEKSKDASYKPYVEGVKANAWYKDFSKRHFEGSMEHELWIIHYVWGHKAKIYNIHPNLVAFTEQKNVFLANHRAEKGLHYVKKNLPEGVGAKDKLLTAWNDSYIQFPQHPTVYDAYGNLVPQYM